MTPCDDDDDYTVVLGDGDDNDDVCVFDRNLVLLYNQVVFRVVQFRLMEELSLSNC